MRYAFIYDIVQECWDNFLSSDFGRDQFLRFSESLDKLLLPIDLDVVCHVIAEFLIGISSNSFTTCASLERRRSSSSLHNTNINMKLKEKGNFFFLSSFKGTYKLGGGIKNLFMIQL